LPETKEEEGEINEEDTDEIELPKN